MTTFGLLSQMEKTNDSFKLKQQNKIIINQRYLLQKLSMKTQFYNIYQGIDINQHKFVTIYIKPFSNAQTSFSKNIKQQFRIKVAPMTKWIGTQKIEKSVYLIQIQEKFGPSIKKMFNHLKQPISDRGFIHLFYQMIKLVEKISAANYVHRELSPQSIVFDSNPQKNDLYILNCFSLKKKNQETQKFCSKYCSRGSHLGLNAHVKDDLQSICYILLEIYSKGQFLKNQSIQGYQSAKSSINPREVCKQIPQIFVDFYYYVANLNYTDDVNFFNWKNLILKHISKEAVSKPYEWMIINKNNSRQTEQQTIENEWKQEQAHVIDKIQKFHIKINQKKN